MVEIKKKLKNKELGCLIFFSCFLVINYICVRVHLDAVNIWCAIFGGGCLNSRMQHDIWWRLPTKSASRLPEHCWKIHY